MNLLGQMDAMDVSLKVVAIVVTIVLAPLQIWIGTRIRRLETLEKRLEAQAKELIDARFDMLSGSLESSISALATAVEGIEQRLARGDQMFRELVEGDHRNEVKLMARFEQQNAWIRDNMATKHDVERLKDRFESLQQAVAKEAVANRRRTE